MDLLERVPEILASTFFDEATYWRSEKILWAANECPTSWVSEWAQHRTSVFDLKAETLFITSCKRTRVLAVSFLWVAPSTVDHSARAKAGTKILTRPDFDAWKEVGRGRGPRRGGAVTPPTVCRTWELGQEAAPFDPTPAIEAKAR